MKVGIIGSGGREHALCLSIKKSPRVDKIYCFPGNAGTSNIAENIEIDLSDFNKIKEFSIKNEISLLIIGPEKPLVDGIVDFFKDTKINIFGPDKISSQLEGSKIFTKKICEKHNIPTAKFGIFENANDAISFWDKTQFPLVVKAEGLASGKGVYICENKDDANLAIKEVFNGKFGLAKNILIEEFLIGEEMSYFIISDGREIKSFETAQDHKRVLEGDKGANTGGMGAYSPSRLLNQALEEKILNKIIKPTIKALKEMGSNYKGFLYAGLMIVKDEPYLIEYNVRMGDPETEVVFPRISTDVIDLFDSLGTPKFNQLALEINPKHAVTIILVSGGYPEEYEKEKVITGLSDVKESFVFHAGTKQEENNFVTNGGRVLAVTSISDKYQQALKLSYAQIQKLGFEKMYYRKDIGFDL